MSRCCQCGRQLEIAAVVGPGRKACPPSEGTACFDRSRPRYEVQFTYANALPADLDRRGSFARHEGRAGCSYVRAESAAAAEEKVQSKAARYGREIEIRWVTRCRV